MVYKKKHSLGLGVSNRSPNPGQKLKSGFHKQNEKKRSNSEYRCFGRARQIQDN